MTVLIISEDNQERILLTYQKDYGALVLAYNKLGSFKNAAAVEILSMKAEILLKEIINDINPKKKFFSEENSVIAKEIISTIHNFVEKHLNISTNNMGNITYFPYYSKQFGNKLVA